jgi:hypothetical protein
VPLVLSICNRYRPTVEEFLDHVDDLRSRFDWDRRVRLERIERVRPVPGGFALDAHGVFQHVLLATGHPGLAVPPELDGDPRVVHAYEPHDYADDVAIVGGGMAAATEWLNALEAGASVVSVRRHEPVRRPLTVSRDLFSRRGLAGYHRTPPRRRTEMLEQLLTPSYPPGRAWDEPLERAAADGRFRVERSPNGERQVICATGFLNCLHHDPLISVLVAEQNLETRGRWLVLGDDCTVAALTDDERTLVVTGVLAQWAYPAADTLLGMKYAARSFLRRVRGCPTR